MIKINCTDFEIDIDDVAHIKEKIIIEIMVKAYYHLIVENKDNNNNNVNNNNFVDGHKFIQKIYDIVNNDVQYKNVYFWNNIPETLKCDKNIVKMYEDDIYEKIYTNEQYFEYKKYNCNIGTRNIWSMELKIDHELVNYFIIDR